MIVIIGAGISGLTVGKFLKGDFRIVEKENHSGGLSTQYFSKGNYFDYGGHYFHFKDKPEIKSLVEKFCGFNRYKRNSKVYIFGKFIPFPVQFHLSSFPKKVSKKILSEILASRGRESENLKDFLIENFGKTLSEYFFFPFLTKYYRKDLKQIIPEKDRGSIPVPDKRVVVEGFRGKRFSDTGYNPEFFYPKTSLRKFMESYESDVKDKISFNREILKVDLDNHRVHTEKESFPYEKLVSTIPLKDLIAMTGDRKRDFPEVENLEHISTVVVNVILKEKRRRFHWIYIPQREIGFYRAGFYPERGMPVCYLERSLPPEEEPDFMGIKEEAVSVLKELKLIVSENEILLMDIKKIPVSYIIFNRHWNKDVPALLKRLKSYDVESIGRFGRWDYTSMSEDIRYAREIAESLNSVTE